MSGEIPPAERGICANCSRTLPANYMDIMEHAVEHTSNGNTNSITIKRLKKIIILLVVENMHAAVPGVE